MKVLFVCLLTLTPVLRAQGDGRPEQAPPLPEAPPDGPQLGIELAAIGPACRLTFSRLDNLLLLRHGNSPLGQSTLQGLAQLVVVEKLAKQEGISASRADLNQRWRTLEEQIVSSGTAASMAEYLEAQGIKRKTFQRHLLLSVLHERLARKGLGLGPDDPLSGEQQTRWLNEVLKGLEQQKGVYPWTEGPVLSIGPHVVTRKIFGEYLRGSLPQKDLRAACYELLLEDRIRARLPDLTSETIEAAVTAEVDRRRKEVEANSTFQGVAYEQLLGAQGLTLATVRKDPAIRAGAMAHLFVDRSHGDEELRAVYGEERALFDSVFGEGHAISVLVLSAVRFPNELNPRTFEKAEAKIEELKERIASPEDFHRMVGLHSNDPSSKEQEGYLGVITRSSKLVPEAVCRALWGHIDAKDESPQGDLIGPLRLQGGVLLLQIGAYRPIPTWEGMSALIHQELRRRLVRDALPPAAVSTWLDL